MFIDALTQEMEACVNGVVEEVLAREYRDILREVLFELAQVSKNICDTTGWFAYRK